MFVVLSAPGDNYSHRSKSEFVFCCSSRRKRNCLLNDKHYKEDISSQEASLYPANTSFKEHEALRKGWIDFAQTTEIWRQAIWLM
jgi:hypothetical protein